MTYATPQRKPPGGVGRWFLKAPQGLYRLRLGWILGRRFVLVEHTGRKSGLTRSTVLEVIRHDDRSLDVAAAWGAKSDWFRNIQRRPEVQVSTGRLREVPATAALVEQSEALQVFAEYAAAHKIAARGLAKTFDLPLGDAAAMAQSVPVVRFTLTTAGR